MSKYLVLALAVAAVAGVVLYVQSAEPRRWTTDSPEALAAYERGLEADMKLYFGDAVEHYSQALAADPDFVLPRLRLARRLDWGSERKEELLDDLRAADLDRLSDVERFLVRYHLAREEGRRQDAERILADFAAEHPDEPFGLSEQAAAALADGRFDEAERFYAHLVETEPNWVNAQNMLGYLSMRRGDFLEAENRFRTFQFIAPGHANPHDSMAELLLLLGRYEEAEAELEAALALRADFTPAYTNLMRLALLEQDPLRAAEVVERAEAAELPGHTLEHLRCTKALLDEALASARGETFEAQREPAARDEEAPGEFADCRLWYTPLALRHRLLLLAGDRQQALELEAKVAALTGSEDPPGEPKMDYGFLEHLRGYRFAAEGDYPAARIELERAGEIFSFPNLVIGMLNLRNRMLLAETYDRLGKEAAARRARTELDRINPRFRELEPLLGLPRE